MAADDAVAAAAFARRILNAHPPDRLCRPAAPQPHLLVLGANALAREVCRGLLRLCHFRHGVPPAVTLAAPPGAIASVDAFVPGEVERVEHSLSPA